MDEKMYSVEPVMVSTPSYEFQPMADVEKEFLSLFEELIIQAAVINVCNQFCLFPLRHISQKNMTMYLQIEEQLQHMIYTKFIESSL